MRMAIVCCCLVMFVGLLGASAVAADDADEAGTNAFRQLLNDEWQWGLEQSPTFASALGDKRFNDRWPDLTLTAIAARHDHLKDVLARLAKIDAKELAVSDQLNYRLFQKQIASDVEEYPFRWFLVPLDQRGGSKMKVRSPIRSLSRV